MDNSSNFVVDYSEYRNNLNVDFVRQQILHKNSNTPYFALDSTVTNVVTDMDHFPYSRWYRGVYDFSEPIVAEREAGFRKLENDAYKPRIPIKPEKNRPLCFQAPCSTVYPCFADDKNSKKHCMNDNCITFSP